MAVCDSPVPAHGGHRWLSNRRNAPGAGNKLRPKNVRLVFFGLAACRLRVNDAVSRTVDSMNVRRRPRGSLVEPRRVTVTLEAEWDEYLVKLANHLTTTKSALTQWLIASAELDERGFPVGWPEEPRRDGELPIDSD